MQSSLHFKHEDEVKQPQHTGGTFQIGYCLNGSWTLFVSPYPHTFSSYFC